MNASYVDKDQKLETLNVCYANVEESLVPLENYSQSLQYSMLTMIRYLGKKSLVTSNKNEKVVTIGYKITRTDSTLLTRTGNFLMSLSLYEKIEKKSLPSLMQKMDINIYQALRCGLMKVIIVLCLLTTLLSPPTLALEGVKYFKFNLGEEQVSVPIPHPELESEYWLAKKALEGDWSARERFLGLANEKWLYIGS